MIPLDTDYPYERLSYIVQDANIHMILTDSENSSKANELYNKIENKIIIINLDNLKNLSEYNNDLLFPVQCKPDFLAYILYTSGSTGTPKGVMQTHKYLLNLIYSFTNSLHISKEDCLTLIPSFNFSASVMDLFGALLNGASLYLIDIKKIGILGLIDLLIKQNITIYHSVPTVFRSVAEEMLGQKNALKVRLIYLAGEALLKSDVELFKNIFLDNTILVNGLGCTEFNICRQFFINHESEITSSIVPVGYKALNGDVIIVDEDGNENKNYTVGEIAVKSNYISAGYQNSPELTKQKIKFNRKINEWTYYTGDLGRKQIDGCLIHLGRKDFQVKLRGQRIEIFEIESALLKRAEIKRAVVLLKGNDKQKYLCAYVVVEKELNVLEIKEELLKLLPNYMIPSYFVQMDFLPLTDTGKVDRRNLPEPIISEQQEDIFVFTEIEEELKSLWAEVLNIDPSLIMRDSVFFDIGGNSLTSMILLSKINKKFCTNFTISDIFRNQTVKQFSELIEENSYNYKLVIAKVAEKEYYPLSHTQLSIYIQEQVVNYNITRGFILKGRLDLKALEQSFQQLIERHEILRTGFFTFDGCPLQKIYPYQEHMFRLVYRKVDYSFEDTDCVEKEMSKEMQYRFDLEQPPLLKVCVIEDINQNFAIFLSIHHIISDGWSMEILSKEVWTNYHSLYSNKKNMIFKELPWQYKDFSVWQNNMLVNKHFEEQKQFWMTVFKDGVPILNLPMDRPRTKVKSFQGKLFLTIWNNNLSNRLKVFCKEKNVTLFGTLTAILNTFLYKYTGEKDFVLGTLTAYREKENFAEQIGFYANMLALRTKIKEREIFTAVLFDTQKTIIEAFENQDYPIDLLADDLHLKRELNRSLFFDIVVILHGDWLSTTSNILSELTIEEIYRKEIHSKFDITFNIIEKTEGLHWNIEYNTSLFDQATIEIMMEKLKILTFSILDNPKLSINDYDILLSFEHQEYSQELDFQFNF